jgi:hypothetical protein
VSNTTIQWNEGSPAAGDTVASGPGAINSIQSNIRTGLASEHVWPSSTGPAGAHLLGSARVFVGTTSQVSSADTAGRLMFASDTSHLWYVGSDGTVDVTAGGPTALQSTVSGGQGGGSILSAGYHMAFSLTTVAMSAGRISASNLFATAFSAPPMVFTSIATQDAAPWYNTASYVPIAPTAFGITATRYSLVGYYGGTGVGTATIGPIVSGVSNYVVNVLAIGVST